MLMLQRFVLF